MSVDLKMLAVETAKLRNPVAWELISRAVFDTGLRGHEAADVVDTIWAAMKTERVRLRHEGEIQSRVYRKEG